MNQEAFQFLQLTDLRLELPCGGLSEVPDQLREVLIDAPYRATERIIELAIDQRVDFVLLSGNTCDVQRAGPRAALFLEQQFERLNEKNIPIYWAAGPRDPIGTKGSMSLGPRTCASFLVRMLIQCCLNDMAHRSHA